MAKRNSIEKCYFDLKKGQFRDGIAQYGLNTVKLPSTCAYGEIFNGPYALQCPKDGYTHIRHNDSNPAE